MKKAVVNIEYWFDGVTSSYQVTKKDYYNSYLSDFPKFRVIYLSDGSNIISNN